VVKGTVFVSTVRFSWL